jgi:iron complex outermembrane receptor protein
MSIKIRIMSGAASAAVMAWAAALPSHAQAQGPTPTAANTVLAQADAPNPAAAGSGTIRSSPGADSTVGEVVVTAERRTQDIQKVPIAITAISGAELQAQGVTGFADLSTAVPSLRFGSGVTGGENVITMRGLGSQNTTPTMSTASICSRPRP